LNNKILVSVLTYNEGDKLKSVLNRLDYETDYDVLIVDDGSTDKTSEFLNSTKFNFIKHEKNSGVGSSILTAIKYAKINLYDIIVIMAANGKMAPEEIDKLINPLIQDKADYVQGSRYLIGGRSENLPLFRKITIKIFTFFVNLFMGSNGSDITCGFRAYNLKIFDHPDINLNQNWLEKYEMEYYIHYKVVKLGYKITEVPVSMIYPQKGEDYSKIKPFIGWWSMIRPWFFLILKIKK
jgi:dolichol-phosphate mannosyltransferase